MALVDLLSGVMQVALVEVDATDKLAEVQGEGRCVGWHGTCAQSRFA